MQSNELVDPGEGLKAKATYASDVYALGMVRCSALVRMCVSSLTVYYRPLWQVVLRFES